MDPISAGTLRNWVHIGLVPPDRYDPESGQEVLTFDDVLGLEIVRRLRRESKRAGKLKKTSLQKIRRVEARLREDFGIHRPFARKIFYSDGASVWAEVMGPDGSTHLLEMEGKRPDHLV